MLRPWYIAFLDLKRFLLNPGELAFSIALPVLLFALMYGAAVGRLRTLLASDPSIHGSKRAELG